MSSTPHPESLAATSRQFLRISKAQERRRGLLACDIVREWIQLYVTALAITLCIRPRQLRFRWEFLKDMKVGQGGESVHTLQVHLAGNWATIVFHDSEIRNLRTTPARILAAHKAEILEAIQSLLRVPRQECP